ncbi:hypothetical protein V6N11_048554 [Hibiscus sabdariffa]|uniref:Serine-threonine/tyrosine-protein kinase catalytic domain-containing protein n=1 Tax=Hibiscus sabdariffa TaxID=183260 RepID=A0ABR2PVL4_9ROSI
MKQTITMATIGYMAPDEMSLKDFVKESSFDSLTKVIDVTILQEGDVHFTAKTNCIWSVLELALDCSAESPDRRRNMVDVVAELKKIKTRYHKDVRRPAG